MTLFLFLSAVAGYLACFCSLFVTAWVRDYFFKRDWVDRPNEGRKQQKKPVAYGGGTAVLISTSVALLIVGFSYANSINGQIDFWPLAGLAAASVLLWAVGLYDDIVDMSGVKKLLCQLVAACLVVAPSSGMTFEIVEVMGFYIPLGHLGVPLAIFWILAAINSLNLLDGMDALASSVGLLLSLTIGAMALITGRWLEAIIAFSMAGSLIGFLRHNWPPARIYLGDSGSMLIGLVLGSLALRCDFKDATSIAIAAPIAIFAIPLIDSMAAIVRRKLTGRSLYSTDRGHIHHRLLTQGMSNQQAVFLIGGFCAITCAGSILSVYCSAVYDIQFPFGLIAVGIVVMLLLGTRVFGHSELLLLNTRLLGFGRRILPGDDERNSTVRLQGSLEWEEAWESLVDSAPRFNLMKIRLNLYLPKLHEDFYATWRRRSRTNVNRHWTVDIPLVVDGDVVGLLNLTGVQENGSVAPRLSDLADLVLPLEKQLAATLGGKGETSDEQLETSREKEVASRE